MPKCKICRKNFERKSNSQVVCSYECSLEYGKKQIEKKEAKKKTEANRAKREFRKNDKPMLLQEAQRLSNKYGRLKDIKKYGVRCCTCGIKTGKMDGGHFLPTSSYGSIRFNSEQIKQQCIKCNRFNGGMPKEYREYMIYEYGLEYVLKLENTKGELRGYSVEYLQRLIKILRKKIKKIMQNS